MDNGDVKKSTLALLASEHPEFVSLGFVFRSDAEQLFSSVWLEFAEEVHIEDL